MGIRLKCSQVVLFRAYVAIKWAPHLDLGSGLKRASHMVLMTFAFSSPFFWQNNQVLGIGSGSTIVHAVQRIGMLSGCLLDVLWGTVGWGCGGAEEGGAKHWHLPNSALL